MSTWEESAEGNNNMSEGYHLVKCVKVMREKKDGTIFRTSKGDPSLLVVYANQEGDETATMYTLTDNAKQFLAKDLSRLGADIKKMDTNGVTIRDFEREEFASQVMLGNTGYARAVQDGQYTNLHFFHEKDLPIGDVQRLKKQAEGTTAPDTLVGSTPEVDDEDIPF